MTWTPSDDLKELLNRAGREGKLLRWAGDYDVIFTPAELLIKWAEGRFQHGAINWDLVDPPFSDWMVSRTATSVHFTSVITKAQILTSQAGISTVGIFFQMDAKAVSDLKQILDMALWVSQKMVREGDDVDLRNVIPSWMKWTQ